MTKMPNDPESPSRWTVYDVLGVQWVVMRFLAVGSTPRATIQRRLHCADHMLPCLQTPSVMGAAFDKTPSIGPLLALCSFIVDCQRRPADWDWCRTVLWEAQIDVPEMLAAIEPLANLYVNPHDVPVQLFQPNPEAYALIPISELPYGGSMHSCNYQYYFDKERRKIARRRAALRVLGKGRSDASERTQAGQRLTEAILRGALNPANCRQHQAPIDWDKVNTEAEHIRLTVRPWTRVNVKVAAQAAEALTDPERNRLENLFLDPTRWDRGAPEVVGGQHRLCGYHVASTTHAFVAIGIPDN